MGTRRKALRRGACLPPVGPKAATAATRSRERTGKPGLFNLRSNVLNDEVIIAGDAVKTLNNSDPYAPAQNAPLKEN